MDEELNFSDDLSGSSGSTKKTAALDPSKQRGSQNNAINASYVSTVGDFITSEESNKKLLPVSKTHTPLHAAQAIGSLYGKQPPCKEQAEVQNAGNDINEIGSALNNRENPSMANNTDDDDKVNIDKKNSYSTIDEYQSV